MDCPYCGFKDTVVIESRPEADVIRRRRECKNPICLKRFTTYEVQGERYERLLAFERAFTQDKPPPSSGGEDKFP